MATIEVGKVYVGEHANHNYIVFVLADQGRSLDVITVATMKEDTSTPRIEARNVSRELAEQHAMFATELNEVDQKTALGYLLDHTAPAEKSKIAKALRQAKFIGQLGITPMGMAMESIPEAVTRLLIAIATSTWHSCETGQSISRTIAFTMRLEHVQRLETLALVMDRRIRKMTGIPKMNANEQSLEAFCAISMLAALGSRIEEALKDKDFNPEERQAMLPLAKVLKNTATLASIGKLPLPAKD